MLLALAAFVGWSAVYAASTARLMYLVARHRIWGDGNSIIDPLWPILNIGTPIAMTASISLLVLSYRGIGKRSMACVAVLSSVVVSAALLGWGCWFYAVPLEGRWKVADVVWWL